MCIFILVCTPTLVLKSRLMWMEIRIIEDDDDDEPEPSPDLGPEPRGELSFEPIILGRNLYSLDVHPMIEVGTSYC